MTSRNYGKTTTIYAYLALFDELVFKERTLSPQQMAEVTGVNLRTVMSWINTLYPSRIYLHHWERISDHPRSHYSPCYAWKRDPMAIYKEPAKPETKQARYKRKLRLRKKAAKGLDNSGRAAYPIDSVEKSPPDSQSSD